MHRTFVVTVFIALCIAEVYGVLPNAPVNPAACSCLAVYDPVCGSDKKTYSNACQARCANVKVVCKGEKCGPCSDKPSAPPSSGPCICPTEHDPVCGKNSVQYKNRCEAKCADVDVECVGDRCGSCSKAAPCPCTREYRPVCGEDGLKYNNPCLAKCAKVKIECVGNGCGRCHQSQKPKPQKPVQQPCLERVVNCIRDPCEGQRCEAHPTAYCVASYCGGCHANWYLDDAKVSCEPASKPYPSGGHKKCAKQNQGCSEGYTFLPLRPHGSKQCCPGLQCCQARPLAHGKFNGFLNVGICLHKCPALRG